MGCSRREKGLQNGEAPAYDSGVYYYRVKSIQESMAGDVVINEYNTTHSWGRFVTVCTSDQVLWLFDCNPISKIHTIIFNYGSHGPPPLF